MLCPLCGRLRTPDHDCRSLVRPTPVAPAWARAVENGVAVVVAGGVTLFLVAVVATPTMGARRSTHLKWQEREQAILAASSAARDAAPGR